MQTLFCFIHATEFPKFPNKCHTKWVPSSQFSEQMRNKVGAFFFLGWGNRWIKGKPMTHVAIFLQFGAQVGIL